MVCGPANRESSYRIAEQLKVQTSGEQKIGPFPAWVISTALTNAGKRYPFISLPVSDWYAGTPAMAQSLEDGHNPESVHALVDEYYSLGGLINLYNHSSSAGGGFSPYAGEYVSYSVTKSRLWPANAADIYQWWSRRSPVQITPSFANSNAQSIVSLVLSNAIDPQTAIELLLPGPNIAGLQVFLNGAAAGTNSYRTLGQTVRMLVGNTVTNAEVRYELLPVARWDALTVGQDATLMVPAPGVLANDRTGLGASLTAIPITAPTNGTLFLSQDGGFSYTPYPGFNGMDGFTYQVNDGVAYGNVARVDLTVAPKGTLFFDDFTSKVDPTDFVDPWIAALGHWGITNGILQAVPDSQSYGFACLPGTWTDYSVEAAIRFVAGTYGGGLAGRVEPFTGARYAAWVYPDTSLGGPNVLRLIKFQNWTSWSYNNLKNTPMQIVPLPSVGTNWHKLKLSFSGVQVSVSWDGNQVITTSDIERQPYLSGGIGVELYRDIPALPLSIDNVQVFP